MSKEIIRQLKSLKHAETGPSEVWLKKSRELLLSQIKNTMPTESKARVQFKFDNFWQATSIFLPQRFVYKVMRPVMTVALIAAMGVSSWVATVSASYQSLPGERLYSAKRVIEKTKVVVADVVGDKNEVVKLHVEFALSRAHETNSLISKNDPSKVQIVAKTVNDLKDEIKTVNSKLEEIKTTAGSGTEVKNINRATQDIQKVLKEVKVNLLANDAASNGDLSTQVLEAKSLVKETSVKAVEAMVAKHLGGDTSISKGEVEQAINEQLQSAVTEAAASKQSMEEVNKALGVVKNEVNAIAQDNKSALVASDAQTLSAKIQETSIQTQAAVDTSNQFSVETGKTVDEGKVLLSQGDFSEAMDKVKAANEVSAKAEQITDNTLKALQGILPVVAVVADTQNTVSSSAIISTTPASSSLNIGFPVSGTIKINASATPFVIPKITSTSIKQL